MEGPEYLTKHFTKQARLHKSKKTEVWEIIDRETGEPWILKRVARTGLVYSELAKIHHRVLPEICFVAEENGVTYVVEEYLDGYTVADHIRMRGHFTEWTTKTFALEICDCLSLLHSHGIIHRDIKPSNIIIAENGLKLIDFDAARIEKEGRAKDTVCIGTRGFAAPEQYGFTQTDARSDIYSLGATLRVMLGEDYNGTLTDVIARCTEFDARYRFASMDELAEALDKGIGFLRMRRWRNSLYYHAYHLLPFALIAAVLWLIAGISGFDGWREPDAIVWHTGAAVAMFLLRLAWQQKKLWTGRIRILDVSPVRFMTRVRKALWFAGYVAAWYFALFALLIGVGMSHYEPWGRALYSAAALLPPLLAWLSLKGKLLELPLFPKGFDPEAI